MLQTNFYIVNISMGKKNILFMEVNIDGTIGGSYTCLYNLVENLDKSKFKIWIGFYRENIFVEKFHNIKIGTQIFSRNPVVEGNSLYRKIANWYRLNLKGAMEIKRFIKEKKIDLVVLNNSIATGYIFVCVCKKTKVPIISYERGFGIYDRKYIKATKRLKVSLPVSYAILNNLKQQNFSSKHFEVIYDGIKFQNDADIKPKSKEIIKKKLGIPGNSQIIGSVGNIREWKGQEYFVKAFLELAEKYKNLYGILIGSYGEEDKKYYEYIKNLSESSEVGSRLLFLGYRDDVPNLFSIMNVFIHTSIKPEPFGMVLLEAMVHKVPVIATKFGGPVEILDNGKCGILVPPSDESAIIEGVDMLLNNPLITKNMVEKAYERVADKFNQEKTIKNVEKLFLDIFNGCL